MRIAFELSGEHPTLPQAEAMAVIKAYGMKEKQMLSCKGILLVELEDVREDIAEICSRLALSHRVLLVLSYGRDVKRVVEQGAIQLRSMEKQPKSFSFRIRIFGSSAPSGLEAMLGGIVHEKTGMKVSFDNPDVRTRVIISGDLAVFGIVLCETERKSLFTRLPHERSFFHPGALAPTVARTLVNLAQAMPSHMFLDPFCGTGSLLIEAVKVGARAVGGDADEEMVKGTLKNLKNIQDVQTSCADVIVLDATTLPIRDKKIHSIAFDPPYGRSAKLFGVKNMTELYKLSLEECERVMEKGRKAVFAYALNLYEGEPPEELAKDVGLRVVEKHTQRVHKSLIRRIVVVEKI